MLVPISQVDSCQCLQSLLVARQFLIWLLTWLSNFSPLWTSQCEENNPTVSKASAPLAVLEAFPDVTPAKGVGANPVSGTSRSVVMLQQMIFSASCEHVIGCFLWSYSANTFWFHILHSIIIYGIVWLYKYTPLTSLYKVWNQSNANIFPRIRPGGPRRIKPQLAQKLHIKRFRSAHETWSLGVLKFWTLVLVPRSLFQVLDFEYMRGFGASGS